MSEVHIWRMEEWKDVHFEKRGRWSVDQRPVVSRGQGVHTHCGLKSASRLLTECALDLRDTDVDPLPYIGVHRLGRAPNPQCIQLLLEDDMQLVKYKELILRRFRDRNFFEQSLRSPPVVCQAP